MEFGVSLRLIVCHLFQLLNPQNECIHQARDHPSSETPDSVQSPQKPQLIYAKSDRVGHTLETKESLNITSQAAVEAATVYRADHDTDDVINI